MVPEIHPIVLLRIKRGPTYRTFSTSLFATIWSICGRMVPEIHPIVLLRIKTGPTYRTFSTSLFATIWSICGRVVPEIHPFLLPNNISERVAVVLEMSLEPMEPTYHCNRSHRDTCHDASPETPDTCSSGIRAWGRDADFQPNQGPRQQQGADQSAH